MLEARTHQTIVRASGRSSGASGLTGTGTGAAYLRDARELLRRFSVGVMVFSGVLGSFAGLGAAAGSSPTLTATLPPIAAGGIFLAALVVHLLARSQRISDRQLHRVGLAFIVVLASLAAVAHTFREAHLHGMVGPFGPAVLVIAIFPLALPSPPRQTLPVAGLAALLNVAVLLMASAWGVVDISPPEVADIVGVSLGSVALAYFSSRMVFKLQADAAAARTLGAYELDEKLGEGGMGEVWTARHQLIKRRAAIKLVRPEELGGEGRGEALERFYREALATSALESVHTVSLFDFGVTEDGTLYYVMELLDGLDLATLVQKFGPQPPSRVVQILRQVCESLAEAHDVGLVHRDIKPANIMICRQGRAVDFVKVLDFGVVSLQPEQLPEGSDELTRAGAMVGTPAFMAPEAIEAGKVDARADLYSLGCVAYWLLTGEKVFRQTSVLAMASAHLHQAPEAPSARGVEVPEALDELVLALLAKNPLKRPADAEEVLELLEACDPAQDWSPARARMWWRTHGPEKLSTSAPLRAVRRSIEAAVSAPGRSSAASRGPAPRRQFVADATLERTGGESMRAAQLDDEIDVTRAD